MSTSRHFTLPSVSLKSPYKIWIPTDNNLDSDSDNERFRSQIRIPGQSSSSLSAQPDQLMTSNSRLPSQDAFLSRTVSSPAPLPSTYHPQSSNSNISHHSATQSSSQFTKQHTRRATTASIMPQASASSHKSYLHALDPRTYLSKRSHTDKTDKVDKAGFMSSTEQLSSAEEGGREPRKTRHGRSSNSTPSIAIPSRSGHNTITPYNDHPVKGSSNTPPDYEHNERMKRRRAKEDRYQQDFNGVDRLFPGNTPVDSARAKLANDVEVHAAMGTRTEQSMQGGQRHRAHSNDPSYGNLPVSLQASAPLTKGTLASLRASNARDGDSPSSMMFSPVMVVATLPTTSSQSTVRDHHVRTVSAPSASVVPRGNSPLPSQTTEMKSAKDNGAETSKSKDHDRSRYHDKDRYHTKKDHSHRHHREKALSLPVNTVTASGSDSEQPGVKESHHQRIAGHSSALRANHALLSAESSSNLLQEALLSDSKRPSGRKIDDSTVSNKAIFDGPAVPPKSPKIVEKLKLEPIRTSTPLDHVPQSVSATSISQTVGNVSQSTADRIPSRTGRRTPNPAHASSPSSAGISPRSPVPFSPRHESNAPLTGSALTSQHTGRPPIAVSRSVPSSSQHGSASSHSRHGHNPLLSPLSTQHAILQPVSKTSSNNSHMTAQMPDHVSSSGVYIPRNSSNSSVTNQNNVTSPKPSQQYIQPASQDLLYPSYPSISLSHQDSSALNHVSNSQNSVASQPLPSAHSTQVLSSYSNVSFNEINTANAQLTPHMYKTSSRSQDQSLHSSVPLNSSESSRPPPYERGTYPAEVTQGRYESLPALPPQVTVSQSNSSRRHVISPLQSVLGPKSKRGTSASDVPSTYHSAQTAVHTNYRDTPPPPPLPNKSPSYPIPSIQPPVYQSVSSETYHISLSSKYSQPEVNPIIVDRKLYPDDSPPPLTLSSSPESFEEILVKPSFNHTVVAPQPRRPEEAKKKSILSLFKSSSKSAPKHEIWYPPAAAPGSRREKIPTKSANSSSTMVATSAPLDIELLNSKFSRPTPEPILIPGSGRKSPAKPFGSIRLFGSRRHRTVSAASLEALDGTANNTVVGSPTSSMRTSTPGPMTSPSPPPRDPFLATQEWRNNEEKELEGRGTHRRRRPGVTFDLSEDDVPKSRDDYYGIPISRTSRAQTGR